MNKQTIKEYFMIAVGTVFVATGIHFFMAPQNLATGGVSGLSIVLTDYIPLPISLISLVINLLLLIVGFIFIGKEFGGKTIFSTVMMSASLRVMELWFPVSQPVTNEILLNLIAGVIVASFGMSLVFAQNSSTGGTDIIAKLLNVYFNFDMGKGLMAADVVVVGLAFFTFGIQTGIIGALGWFVTGIVINYFIDGYDVKREVVVITKKPEAVKQFIFNRLDRGVTIYMAKGGYTDERKDIVTTIVGKKEYFILKKELPNIDSEMFVLARTVHEVIGNGFSRM